MIITPSGRSWCSASVTAVILVCGMSIIVFAQSGMVVKPTITLGVGAGYQGGKSKVMSTTDFSVGAILFMENPAVVLRLSGGSALMTHVFEPTAPPALIIKCQVAYKGEDMDNIPFIGFMLRKHLFSDRQDIGGETDFVTSGWDGGIAVLLGYHNFVRPTLFCEWTIEYALVPDIEYRHQSETRSRRMLFLFGWNWTL